MKHLILLSGGLDSTTLLAHLIGDLKISSIEGLFFNYGQQNLVHEQEAVDKISSFYGVKITHISMPEAFLFSRSSLLANNSSEDSWELPRRNFVLLELASSYIEELYPKENAIIYVGVHDTYKDCTLESIEAFNSFLQKTSKSITVKAPLIYMSKQDIIREANRLGVPLNDTRSCLSSSGEPCGKCPTCMDYKIVQERLLHGLLSTNTFVD